MIIEDEMYWKEYNEWWEEQERRKREIIMSLLKWER